MFATIFPLDLGLPTVSLTADQRIRYERNILAPGFGEAGQERLARARVLVVGLGGLGSPVAYYLAAAGVGMLGLMDSERVHLSNLQRQILYSMQDLERPKCAAAADTLSALNPSVHLEKIEQRLEANTAAELIAQYDIVVEASDNFEATFLINDVCLELKKPFATAGVVALSGQAQLVVPGATSCLRCALPEIPAGVPTSDVYGVVGAIPGILGSLEAFEVIRWITGLWNAQPDGSGLLHHVDGDTMRLKTIRIPRRPGCRCVEIARE